MSDPTGTPEQHAEASASWRSDRPRPGAPEVQLTVPLDSLRALSRVRRRVQAFLLSSLGPGVDQQVAEDVVERAVLVIDELASNALRHGDQPADLSIADTTEGWTVTVTDSAPGRPPAPARERPAGQGGYGLYVITDLTTAHGVQYEPDRKLVWACITKTP